MEPAPAEYRERWQRDWAAFASGGGPPADYWARWEQRSHCWRLPMLLLQPLGRDHPALLDPLEPLLEQLGAMEELELAPPGFLHLPVLLVGWLMSSDISYTEMERIWIRAAAGIQRGDAFSLRLGGVSADEDGLYVGVDDGLALRDVRARAVAREPRVAQAARESELEGAYVPKFHFAYGSGRGDRARVIEAVEPYRDAVLGEYAVTRVGVGRLLSDPQIRYPDPDVIAEVALRGR